MIYKVIPPITLGPTWNYLVTCLVRSKSDFLKSSLLCCTSLNCLPQPKAKVRGWSQPQKAPGRRKVPHGHLKVSIKVLEHIFNLQYFWEHGSTYMWSMSRNLRSLGQGRGLKTETAGIWGHGDSGMTSRGENFRGAETLDDSEEIRASGGLPSSLRSCTDASVLFSWHAAVHSPDLRTSSKS